MLLLAGGAAYWYFSSARTRLTPEAIVPVPQLPAALPRAPKHIVLIVEENKDFDDIIGNPKAPYLNELARRSAVFTHSFGVAHPSQPNYFALFAGVTDREGDSCDVTDIAANASNLGSELQQAHRTFVGYAEDLPSTGFSGCSSGLYARKHAPWTHFSNIPSSQSRSLNALHSFDTLPTLAMVIPNLDDDMHNGSIARADAWLRTHIDPLIRWGDAHDTLVIITWDESDAPVTNHIPTLMTGAMVRPGRYDTPITHYHVLRTIEAFYGLAPLGGSVTAFPISGIWK